MEISNKTNPNHSDTSSLETTLTMTGGEGDASYFANSKPQGTVFDAMRPLVEDLVGDIFDKLMEKEENLFRVADTGCATGANTMVAMDLIVKAVQSCSSKRSIKAPEMQVFFNDLPSNDFNTLLKNLPPQIFGDDDQPHENGTYPNHRSYFAVAVAGSHHGRLFPRRSLQFCLSSISLHILSRVPPEVKDKSSEAWNGNHVNVFDDGKVGEAYLRQFTEDFTSYLRARAQEMVEGGGIFIVLPGRESLKHGVQDCVTDSARHIESAIEHMIKAGVVEENLMEKLNMPVYAPNVGEIEKIVEEEGSFEIKRIELKTGFPAQTMTEVKKGEENKFGESEERRYRSGLQSILMGQLGWGNELLDHFFRTIRIMATDNPLEFLKTKLDMLAISLVKRGKGIGDP